MIKFKIFKNERDMKTYSLLQGRKHSDAGEHGAAAFEMSRYSATYLDILANCSKPPFRDPESLKLLQVCRIELMEDHWYSMMAPGPYKNRMKIRRPLFGADTDIQYALTLLHYSRKGVYLSYLNIEKKIWQALSEMPFDILVAAWGNGIDSCSAYLPDDFLIVNYPYCGTEIEVHAKTHIDREDPFFRKPQLTKEDGAGTSIGFHEPESGLYLGKDGLYYMDIHFKHVLEYYWPNDLKEVFRYMTDNLLRYKDHCIKSLRVNYACSIDEFRRLLETERPGMSGVLSDFKDNPESYHMPALPENFKIVSHLPWMPNPDYHNSAMVVEKHADGTYMVYEHEVCTAIGGLEKLVMDALAMRKKDTSLFCLYLSNVYPLKELREMERTICGIRVQWDSLEIFYKDDAWELFAAELKEMISDT